MTTKKRRQEIVEKVLARIQSQGVAIDKDQGFLALIDDWILGRVSLAECRSRYVSILARRMDARIQSGRQPPYVRHDS
jgi:hypothetical protein